jgi:hypothetical protein
MREENASVITPSSDRGTAVPFSSPFRRTPRPFADARRRGAEMP